jgi:hypothetical protein
MKMANKERVFTHPSQLNALSALPFFRTSGVGTLRLGGNIAGHPERKRWERELNRQYYACGCNSSAAALIIALLLGGAWAGYAFTQEQMGGGAALGVPVLFAIGGAIVGKLFGRVRANVLLKQAIKEIQDQWRVEQKPEKDHWICG